jgi:hypothetical protein
MLEKPLERARCEPMNASRSIRLIGKKHDPATLVAVAASYFH